MRACVKAGEISITGRSRGIAFIWLVPDQARCGFHCFPPIITSVLLHKQKARNESRALLASTESAERFHHGRAPNSRSNNYQYCFFGWLKWTLPKLNLLSLVTPLLALIGVKMGFGLTVFLFVHAGSLLIEPDTLNDIKHCYSIPLREVTT